MLTSLFTFGRLLTSELVHSTTPGESLVGVIMGSGSDWPTVEPCCKTLQDLRIKFEYGVVSAHRTPDRMIAYARNAKARGLQVIIACAGGSAHLPGMTASESILPVLGFGPISKTFGPNDVLGSNVRMPSGVPLAFMGFDEAGAINAALEAAKILALTNTELEALLEQYFTEQTRRVPYAPHS